MPRLLTSIRSQMPNDPRRLTRRFAWGWLAVAAVCLSAGPGAAQDRIDDSGYGPIAFCDSLVAVRHHFPSARDTVFHAGNESWPGMAVPDEDGAIVFITDRTDIHRIRRIRSTSSRVSAGDAVRPGQPVGRLLQGGEDIEVFLPEGEVWLLLRERGIGVTIDRKSERVVWRRWTPKAEPENLIPHQANIEAVQMGRRCNDGASRSQQVRH